MISLITDRKILIEAVIYCKFIASILCSFFIFVAVFRRTNSSKKNPVNKRSSRMIHKFAGTCLLIFISMTLNAQENRTFSGFNNNLENKDWGASFAQQIRKSSVNYADGFSSINDAGLPEPRVVSNELFDQLEKINDDSNHSDFVWVFGQFLDHDITLVESSSDPSEFVRLEIPSNDKFFVPGVDAIRTSRNHFEEGTGTEPGNPRQYVNEISAFVDASAIYGSDKDRADWLRTFVDGKLKVSEGNLLPWNTIDGENASEIDPSAPFMGDDTRTLVKLFVAGDVRANENPLLIAIHTLFVREHNRLCDELLIRHPNWTDEQIYQRARKLNGAYLQNITFNEFLPSIGVNLPRYSGYVEDVNPGIMNVFSAAAFRIGHTLINSDLLRMDNSGEELSDGSMKLQDGFFNPLSVVLSGGIDPFFKGMGVQVMQKMDCKVISDLRNFLFGAPGAGGSDLASINIFRGRDRGLSDYNTLRFDFGLPRVNDFEDFAATQADADALRALYGSVDIIDPWVGLLAERHMEDAIFGQLGMAIMKEQFQALRDGDRFYFENDPAFTPSQVDDILSTTMQDIIMRNSDITLMQENVFFAMPHSEIPEGPQVENIALSAVLFPNPVEDQAYLKIYNDQQGSANIKVINANGQLISSFATQLDAGYNNIDLPVDVSWPRGLYNILIEAGDSYNVVKMIKE